MDLSLRVHLSILKMRQSLMHTVQSDIRGGTNALRPQTSIRFNHTPQNVRYVSNGRLQPPCNIRCLKFPTTSTCRDQAEGLQVPLPRKLGSLYLPVKHYHHIFLIYLIDISRYVGAKTFMVFAREALPSGRTLTGRVQQTSFLYYWNNG